MVLHDFAALDRQIRGMVIALRARDRARPSDEDEPAFVKSASSRATFLELRSLGTDPMAEALARWVGHLTIERVTAGDVAAAMRTREQADAPGEARGVAELVRGLLGSERDARACASALATAASSARDATRRWADRRREAVRQLGAAAEGSTLELVEETLGRTQGAFEAVGVQGTWVDVVRSALCRDAGEGWPAKITPRSIQELWARGEILRGVPLDVARLPEPLGASSFARALYAVGESWGFFDHGATMPFCLARAPGDLRPFRRGALFASLVLEPRFHERRLGLGRDRAAAQVRAIGRSAICWLRVAALRVAAWGLLQKEGGSRDFEDLCERCIGRPLPGSMLGVVPRVGPADARALDAAVRALGDRERLRESFDEDWFDNPRAHEALRHENQGPASVDAAPGQTSVTAEVMGAIDRRIMELAVAG